MAHKVCQPHWRVYFYPREAMPSTPDVSFNPSLLSRPTHSQRRPQAPINREITAPEVRLNGENSEQLGIVGIGEALRMAEEPNVDLVEIAPPPIRRSAG